MHHTTEYMFQPCFHTKAQEKHENKIVVILPATKQVPADCSQQPSSSNRGNSSHVPADDDMKIRTKKMDQE